VDGSENSILPMRRLLRNFSHFNASQVLDLTALSANWPNGLHTNGQADDPNSSELRLRRES